MRSEYNRSQQRNDEANKKQRKKPEVNIKYIVKNSENRDININIVVYYNKIVSVEIKPR